MSSVTFLIVDISLFQHMIEQGYKCGICGDPFDGPYEHEAPDGQYANGNIVREYEQVLDEDYVFCVELIFPGPMD